MACIYVFCQLASHLYYYFVYYFYGMPLCLFFTFKVRHLRYSLCFLMSSFLVEILIIIMNVLKTEKVFTFFYFQSTHQIIVGIIGLLEMFVDLFNYNY